MSRCLVTTTDDHIEIQINSNPTSLLEKWLQSKVRIELSPANAFVLGERLIQSASEVQAAQDHLGYDPVPSWPPGVDDETREFVTWGVYMRLAQGPATADEVYTFLQEQTVRVVPQVWLTNALLDWRAAVVSRGLMTCRATLTFRLPPKTSETPIERRREDRRR